MTDLIKAHLDHRRVWRDFDYCYPVISRRSRGVSLGVNLNPDKVCNFDCVYCEVDRLTPAKRKDLDLDLLDKETGACCWIWRPAARSTTSRPSIRPGPSSAA